MDFCSVTGTTLLHGYNQKADGTRLNVLIDGKECEELHVGRLQQFVCKELNNSERDCVHTITTNHKYEMLLAW